MQEAIEDIIAEFKAATRKFPTWPTDPLHALAVLGEEFGELTKEVVQMTYEPHKSSKEALRKEAIQTAAMALRFVVSLEKYEYKEGGQHRQPQSRSIIAEATSSVTKGVGNDNATEST